MSVRFNRQFAPQEGLTKPLQKIYRDEICLNGYWQFAPQPLASDKMTKELIPKVVPSGINWSDVPLKVPSPWNVNGLTDGEGGDFQTFPNYPKQWEEVKCGWLSKTLRIPDAWQDNRVRLHFEAIAGCTRIFVNGQKVQDHFDAFIPCSVDITDYVSAGQAVDIAVWVGHGSLFDRQGKYGYREHVSGSFWGTHITGVWQDVYLQKVPEIFIEDVFVKPFVSKGLLELEVTVMNTTSKKQQLSLDGHIKQWINGNSKEVLDMPEVDWSLGEVLLSIGTKALEIEAHSSFYEVIKIPVHGELPLWAPDHPELLGLTLDILGLDSYYVRFGWREFLIRGKQLYLNGEQIQIKGDSWHFMGVPQMTRRYAYGWYQMLKDVGANGVRLHAQVYPRFYLEMADEMGICVLDESAIWFSDGGPRVDSDRYWDAARDHVKGMVLRDRNHASVFGWSVCNETLEVTHRVYHAPHKYLKRNVQEINGWTQIAKDLDGTRDWISGDGELIPNTKLPTRIIHYADEGIFQWFFHMLRKPWGVGETGRCYYGSPKQVAKFNGDRAYESQLGRMEGLAAEAFDLIGRQRHYKAAYTCVFNLIWYGLKPQPLGLRDKAKAPVHEDGIFFEDYVEGRPGYQPERLGPYCTTINPGYVPNEPLYEAWPLIDAVKDAYSDNYKEKENIWKNKMDTTVRCDQSEQTSGAVIVSEDDNEMLRKQFEHVGVVFETLAPNRRQLIIVDGANSPKVHQINDIKRAMDQGSTLFLWNANETTVQFMEALTGEEVTVNQRLGSAYLISDEHPILRGTSNATWYLSEMAEDYVSQTSISGPWAEKSKTLLEVSKADWRRWNYQSESTKTAKVYRSEHEAQGPGAVMLKRSYGKGELIVSTLDLFAVTGTVEKLIRPMVKNLGVTGLKAVEKVVSAIDKKQRLVSLKVSGNKNIKANAFGEFNLKDYLDHSVLSFWLYSPRSLTDLLIEPGIPRLDLEMKGSVACEFIINGIDLGRFSYDGSNSKQILTGVPLEKGWNKIVLKTAKGKAPGMKIKFRFTCNKKKFLKEIKAIVDRLFRG